MQKSSIIRGLFTAGALALTTVGATNCASVCVSVGTVCAGGGYYGPRYGFHTGNTFYTAPNSGGGAYTGGSYSDNAYPYFRPAPVYPSNPGRMGGVFAPQANY